MTFLPRPYMIDSGHSMTTHTALTAECWVESMESYSVSPLLLLLLDAVPSSAPSSNVESASAYLTQ